MLIITPPAVMPIRRIQWTLKQPHQINRSGWTGRRQVSAALGAATWSVSAEFIPIVGQARAAKWRGFFASLNGQVNVFPVVAVEAPQKAWRGTTIVAGQQGQNTATLAPKPPLLLAGEFLTIRLAGGGWQLVQLTAPITGTTAIFMPPLREAAATGAGSCESRVPFAHVALSEDTAGWSVDPGQVYSFSFTAEEAF